MCSMALVRLLFHGTPHWDNCWRTNSGRWIPVGNGILAELRSRLRPILHFDFGQFRGVINFGHNVARNREAHPGSQPEAHKP